MHYAKGAAPEVTDHFPGDAAPAIDPVTKDR